MQRQKQSGQEDQALAQLASTLVLPREWSNCSSDDMGNASGSSSQPLRIIFSLTIDSHLSWSLYLYNRKLTPAMCSVLYSSQDPLENYFGQQRAQGGRNDNPTIQQCVDIPLGYRSHKLLTLLEEIVIQRASPNCFPNASDSSIVTFCV